jgi:hypothetical protein
MIAGADGKGLPGALDRALNLVRFAAGREAGAVRSVEEIFSGSAKAKGLVAMRAKEWDLYGAALEEQITGAAAFRAAQLKVGAPKPSPVSSEESGVASVVPALKGDVKYKEFSLEGSDRYRKG